ncbi:nucleolar RNA helicase II [Trypanosoma cruzi]|uniref:Nucleolar RNA helicase II n=1 Tax=Trypanosoma cruzi TaxID=5693 RepID=A0A7J6XYP2_TRYCR|nr:nucleolar RNA helicase II [Trypanosoma cruzi]
MPPRNCHRNQKLVCTCVLGVHTAPQREPHGVFLLVSAYIFSANVRHKKDKRKKRQRKKQIAHTKNTYIITHAASRIGALNHNTSKTMKNKTKKQAEAWDDQRTHSHCSRKAKHTQGERERGRPLNAIKTETVTVLRPCSQAGRQRCVSCKREHQRACMGVHAYIQWAHYVCASWGEVRARVHARGHTQRERGRTSVCAGGARLSLTHSHAATTAAAAAHATTRRSKRGEVVWKTAVLPSLFCVFVVSDALAVAIVSAACGAVSLSVETTLVFPVSRLSCCPSEL